MTPIDIVLVTYDEADRLNNCIESIIANTRDVLYTLTVVDNGSSDKTSYILDKHKNNINTIVLDKNMGFPKASNLAIRQTNGDIIVRLDHDVIVPPGWLKRLVSNLDCPNVGMTGPKIVLPNQNVFAADCIVSPILGFHNIYNSEPDLGQRDYVRETDLLIGACWAVKREAFVRAGYSDENYFPAYAEDFDACVAVRHAGYKIVYDGRISVLHDVGNKSEDKNKTQINTEKDANEYFQNKWGHFRDFPLPDTPVIERYRREGLIFQRQKMYKEAEGCFAKAMECENRNGSVLLDLARNFDLAGDLLSAADLYHEACKNDKISLFARWCLAVIYARQGCYSKNMVKGLEDQHYIFGVLSSIALNNEKLFKEAREVSVKTQSIIRKNIEKLPISEKYFIPYLDKLSTLIEDIDKAN